MLEYVLFAVGFFVITVMIQYILYKARKNHNKGKYKIWAGVECVIIICILGIINKNLAYFAGVIGYIVANEIGIYANWHD